MCIEVRDEGAGLSPELRAWLERDGRPTRRGSPKPRGPRRGRGLMIVRSVAAAHGGRLAATPAEHGARLVLELPLAGRARGV